MFASMVTASVDASTRNYSTLEGIRHTEAANDLFVEVAVESGRY
jgi:hypothetical protein